MHTVEIRLAATALSTEMAAMRVWLDERRFEPSSFSCCDSGVGFLVRVDFKVGQEAEAFARQFGGEMNRVSPDRDADGLAGGISVTGLPPDDVVGWSAPRLSLPA